MVFTLVDFAGDPARLRRALDNEWLDICYHVGSRRDDIGRCPRVAIDHTVALGFAPPSPVEATRATPQFQACSVRGACNWCQVDYSTDIQRNEEDGSGWSITVTAYYRLGKGLSPTDPAWSNYTDRYVFLKNLSNPVATPRRDTKEFPPGTVEAAWLSTDGENASGA